MDTLVLSILNSNRLLGRLQDDVIASTEVLVILLWEQATSRKKKAEDTQILLANGEYLHDYIITGLISVGGFGQVYTGFHRLTKQRVAIKVESENAKIPLLRNEVTCLRFLNSRYNRNGEEPCEPILRYITHGKEGMLNYLVMDHCGANLRQLKKATPKDQFRYFRKNDGSYKNRKRSSSFYGTIRYASLNAHNRQDQCCWDDLWSLFYITIENMVGKLPWRFISDKEKVAEMKAIFDFNALKYGDEPCMPLSLRELSFRLREAYREQDSSFYSTPPYYRIIREVVNDLNQRNFFHNSPLDWEMTESSIPKCYEDFDGDDEK